MLGCTGSGGMKVVLIVQVVAPRRKEKGSGTTNLQYGIDSHKFTKETCFILWYKGDIFVKIKNSD